MMNAVWSTKVGVWGSHTYSVHDRFVVEIKWKIAHKLLIDTYDVNINGQLFFANFAVDLNWIRRMKQQ